MDHAVVKDLFTDPKSYFRTYVFFFFEEEEEEEGNQILYFQDCSMFGGGGVTLSWFYSYFCIYHQSPPSPKLNYIWQLTGVIGPYGNFSCRQPQIGPVRPSVCFSTHQGPVVQRSLA